MSELSDAASSRAISMAGTCQVRWGGSLIEIGGSSSKTKYPKLVFGKGMDKIVRIPRIDGDEHEQKRAGSSLEFFRVERRALHVIEKFTSGVRLRICRRFVREVPQNQYTGYILDLGFSGARHLPLVILKTNSGVSTLSQLSPRIGYSRSEVKSEDKSNLFSAGKSFKIHALLSLMICIIVCFSVLNSQFSAIPPCLPRGDV
ncbi:hypothetical protein BT96DRAFT_934090 [Gymnopus androsaceus JB14]|uniref:Uncharacterized protein n=1 Tax=Gymnopus androsaceus JB14 TaxID=1447944 RepID=A0A6A4IBF8_9AGAR|nr:hypothetical protein BT96DRAFT_934090 [Gymnopus androsaceus JB14]